MVLVARRADKLKAVADELRESYATHSITIVADLSHKDACEKIVTRLENENITIECLVNNAGYGLPGSFHVPGWQEHADFMIDFHCGHNAETRWTLFNEDGSAEAKKSMELAKAFGIEIIYPCDYPVLQSAMFTQASNKGIPGIIVESGGGGDLATEEAVNTVAEGLTNMLKYLDV